MPRNFRMTTAFLTALVAVTGFAAEENGPPVAMRFTAQSRVRDADKDWRIERTPVAWKPAETAVVICDMWDLHTCKNATERVGEMAPRMNKVVRELRDRGCLIIHCPSDTLDFYKDHPARQRAQQAKKIETKIPLQGWCHLDKKREAELPIDDSDGGCDTPTAEQAKWHAIWKAKAGDRRYPWTRQNAAIEIDAERDAITASAEAYYLMHERGIKNVIVMGVHTNMCVLGRPFSIRQMIYQGQNVLLMRDMTDAMYNPAMRPQVSHFRGTDLVVEHIERHWCGTITSDQVLGDDQSFVFANDNRPHVVFVIGEREYETARTLPAFAEQELSDYRTTFVFPRKDDGNDFPGLEALKTADLMVVSVRRRALPDAQLAMIREYVASGKPVIGIRTASHAFSLNNKKARDGHAVWPEFDADILGGNYHGHLGGNTKTFVQVERQAKDHPILKGVAVDEFPISSKLYKTGPLAKTTTLLMTGRAEGVKQHEPVAWTNDHKGARVFYTSLGGPGDFENASFRAMLKNAIAWGIGK